MLGASSAAIVRIGTIRLVNMVKEADKALVKRLAKLNIQISGYTSPHAGTSKDYGF